MRNGHNQHQHQHKRMRGRNNNNNNNNNRRNHNPLTRVYESNGPDVKIRGNANHIAEKYLQLARDAQSSGDPISAENYLQHAEHYFRLIAAAQEQFRQNNPNFQPRHEGGEQFQQRQEEGFEDSDDEAQPFAGEAPFGTREPQPFMPRDAQPFVQRDNQNYQPREAREGQPNEGRQPRAQQQQPQPSETGSVDSLPAFITGGAQPQQHANGQNGHDGQSADRYPLHRRRRRHRGPRSESGASADQADESQPS
jgi:Domain of unknown function (DUF4167)